MHGQPHIRLTLNYSDHPGIRITEGLVTTLRAGRFGVRIPLGERDFCLLQNAKVSSGAHPTPCLMDTGVISRGVYRRGNEVNPSSPFSAEVKNEWSPTSAPHMPSWLGQGKLYLYLFTTVV
jgi:hypothetical protein